MHWMVRSPKAGYNIDWHDWLSDIAQSWSGSDDEKEATIRQT